MCVCVCTNGVEGVGISWCICGGQKSALWNQCSSSTSTWVLGTELMSIRFARQVSLPGKPSHKPIPSFHSVQVLDRVDAGVLHSVCRGEVD